MVDYLVEADIECPDRARAGAFARLEGRRQEWDWIGLDWRNIHNVDPWRWCTEAVRKQEVAQE